MAKKKNQETQEEQSDRFRDAVRQMVADGELNPTAAESVIEKILKPSIGICSNQSRTAGNGVSKN